MTSITKKDYLIGALVGFLTGVLALRLFFFLGIDFRFRTAFFLLCVPILWACGVWLGGFMGRWMPFLNQFGKFAAVGFLGAAIDFSILNWVSHSTGITSGITLGWVNVPGFLVAVTNNYLWNKLWVFKSQARLGSIIDPSLAWDIWNSFPKFLGVTLIGLIINSGTIIILTSFRFEFDGQIWLNISKTGANALAMIWNFIGYKFIAFRK